VLLALSYEGYLDSPLIVEGAITMDLFEEWFEHTLLLQLCPSYIVVLNNTSIYHSDLVKELCISAGIQLEFLLLYSPDLNPIEPSFNTLKL
jgi:transposase